MVHPAGKTIRPLRVQVEGWKGLKLKPTQKHTYPPTHSSIQWVTFCLVTAIVARAVTATETVWLCWLEQCWEWRVEICCQVITKIHKLSLLITAGAAGDHTEESIRCAQTVSACFFSSSCCKHILLPFHSTHLQSTHKYLPDNFRPHETSQSCRRHNNWERRHSHKGL